MGRRRGFAVCMFGADGSGKSTLARYVASYLRSEGLGVEVAWLRGTHTFASLLARFLARFGGFRGSCNPYYGICVPRSMRFLWLWIEFVSVLPIVFLRLVVPRLLGRCVVAERSLVDFLVWLAVTLRWGGVLRSFVARAVLALSRSLCTCSIYIRAEERVLLARRRGCREEGLIPLELRIYDALARALGIPTVDTSSRLAAESAAEVLRVVRDGCG